MTMPTGAAPKPNPPTPFGPRSLRITTPIGAPSKPSPTVNMPTTPPVRNAIRVARLAPDSFAAAANVLPVVAVFLGLAMLLHGTLPSWTAGVIGALAVGLYLVELIGPALGWSSWVLDLSPYHHLSLVPTTSPAWAAVGIMLGIGVAASAAGLFGYAHRDLR